ncbi:MAG: choice-of-anchor J domain-containing protein [Bacteroides sp.]|nr:choice-of-anchor J domain-containing protein [Bacteroides sp.]
MKRFACLTALLPLLLAPVFGQVVFQDDFQSADLNRFMAGGLNTDWTLYNDNNKPSTSPDLTYFDDAWKVIRSTDGEMFAASLSLFTNAQTADRWMVTPAINLTQLQNPTLSFRAKAIDAQTRDGFEVKVSVDGIEKEDFKTTLTQVPHCHAIWTYYNIDLSEYKGKSVYVAFVQNSKDQYIIGIDDVVVYDKGNLNAFVNGFSAPFTVISNQDRADVKTNAQLFNAGSETITSYRLCTQADNGQVQKTDVSDIQLASGSTLVLNATVSVDGTGFHTLDMWVENINGQDVSTSKTSIRILSANNNRLPKKNFLLEIFSSGMCTACEPWNRYLHGTFLEQHANVPDNRGNFCIAKYQINIPAVGDPCVTEQTLARGNFYNVNSAPSYYANGRSIPLTIGYENVAKAIVDSIYATNRITVPTGITAYLEREENTFKVHTEITGYLPDPNTYSLVVCLLEDSIHHNRSMHNGETDFYYVVRQMLPGVTGVDVVADEIGKTVTKEFEYTFDLSNPKIFSSLDNMGAVVFLQNKNSREVVQARYLAPGYKDSSVYVNNERPERLQRQLRVYPNPASEYCRIVFTSPANAQARLEIIDLQGKTAAGRNITLAEGENFFEENVQDLAAGMYFVRITNRQGVFVHKLIKR